MLIALNGNQAILLFLKRGIGVTRLEVRVHDESARSSRPLDTP